MTVSYMSIGNSSDAKKGKGNDLGWEKFVTGTGFHVRGYRF